MKQREKRWPVVLGLALCVLTLALSVALQRAGYLTYLNSDMASEVILARQQADSGHLVETQWLYSTEIHLLHMNLLYALAFRVTDSYCAARIIGNTLGFLMGMGAFVYLCRVLRLSWGRALCAAALLPLAASVLYAANMTVGGYYIVHLTFAFLGAGLWLQSARRQGRRRGLLTAAAFAALCALEGLLSVRYVLCFVCPMLVTGVMEALFAPEQGDSLRDGHARFLRVTLLGFAACALGYAVSEVVYPRVFVSGTGAASSFRFTALDGPAMLAQGMTVAADFLKLLGWRAEVALFSPEGLVNLCVAATLVLGGMITVRVCRRLTGTDEATVARRRMLRYAGYAVLVNLFCFVLIEGAYLNRYLIVAVLFLVPALAVVLRREKNMRLLSVFCLVLCLALGGSSALLLRDTVRQQPGAQARGQDMMDAGDYLLKQGYTHGYGTFWHVRVLQERTQGALTFAGIALEETEEGAAVPVAPGLIRWLEADSASDLDACPGRAFLLLTLEEEETLSPWLRMCGAPREYANGTYAVYGFASSEAFWMAMLEGHMTLEGAGRTQEGGYLLQSGGRLRMPPGWREAGSYTLRFALEEGTPAQDSVVELYTGRNFALLDRQTLSEGENALHFALPGDDKYFMIQIKCGAAQGLRIGPLTLTKEP